MGDLQFVIDSRGFDSPNDQLPITNNQLFIMGDLQFVIDSRGFDSPSPNDQLPTTNNQ